MFRLPNYFTNLAALLTLKFLIIMNEKELKQMLSFIISNQAHILKRIIDVENKVGSSTKSASETIAMGQLKRAFDSNNKKVLEVINNTIL